MIKYKICKQKKGFCGPASLKIIFDHYGVAKSQEEWAKLSGTTTKDGVQNSGLIKAIEAVGFAAEVIKEASLTNLKKLIQENQTFLAIWWSGRGGHYSPVANVTEKSIALADPELGRLRRMNLTDFDHLWFDFGKDYDRRPEDLELRSILVIKKQ